MSKPANRPRSVLSFSRNTRRWLCMTFLLTSLLLDSSLAFSREEPSMLSSSSSQTSEEAERRERRRNLRRYDHYTSGSAYKYQRKNGNETVYASLSDIWLCLACALGWTVWLVSATRTQTETDGSIFESQQSRKVFGNVLQVTLGEDSDGTGIPIYHTLVDYVVESEEVDDEPLQVRKCFSTRKLLEEGFANVEVLVLQEDPTTSTLMVDFLQDQKLRARQQMEPPSMIWSIGVYMIAATLIVTSLIGGVHALWSLDPEQELLGKISLGVGGVLLYPLALLLYYCVSAIYRLSAPLTERPGVIIHGARTYWKRKCGATLNPLEIMGTFDNLDPPKQESSTFENSDTTSGGSLELPKMKSASLDAAYLSPRSNGTRSPMYPNAGCGFGNYSVHLPSPRSGNIDGHNTSRTTGRGDMANGDPENPTDLSTISVSDMSSATSESRSNASTRERSNIEDPAEKLFDEYASLQLPRMGDDHGSTSSSSSSKEADGLNPSSGFIDYIPPMQALSFPAMATHELGSPMGRSSVPTPLASNARKNADKKKNMRTKQKDGGRW